jgi:fructose-1,6-bisphosphatase II
MKSERINRNVSLDLVRATEAAALSAGRWMGLGRPDEADHAATQAMAQELDLMDMDGSIIIGEEGRAGIACELPSGRPVGTGNGPQLDVVVDAVDGRRMLAQGRSGAIAVAAVAPQGTMWRPTPAIYMEKLVVNRSAASALVPECLDAPAAWTLALVARAKQKQIRDLVVFVLDRPRHADLIEEIRTAGARVMLRGDGDISGAVMAAAPDGSVDVLMGIGGAAEGVIAACAVKSSGGAMLVRLAPQSEAERVAVIEAGLDPHRILTCDELITSDQVFFSATGISDGPLLAGVRYHGDRAETHSLILRCETGTRRNMQAEHVIAEDRYTS